MVITSGKESLALFIALDLLLKNFTVGGTTLTRSRLLIDVVF